MRLGRLTDYAFILLTALGRTAQMSTSQLAAQSGLGEPTVAKILKYLSHAGLVQSVRGAQGGYSLAKPSAQIDLAAVIEAMEGPIAMTKCTQEKDHDCACAEQCGARETWVDVNVIVRDTLAGITLDKMERRSA